jgi:hypothetical protein
MHLATGAFDPGRGYTSPPGLDPHGSGSPAEIRPGSGSPAEIRLFGFSPEGDTSLPVCVSHRNWENTPQTPQARRAAHPLPVVITTGLGIHQTQSPEGWHIHLGDDHL